MATFTFPTDGKDAGQHLSNMVYKAEVEVDFSANNTGIADVVECIKVPAGAIIIGVYLDITTVEGAADTLDVGDAADPNRFIDNANSAALGVVPATLNLGYRYAAADTIDITTDAAMTACVCRLIVLFCKTEL